MSPPPDDPLLHPHELRLTRLEQARISLEESALVASRLHAGITRSLAELKEIAEVHTRWLVDLDRKLDRIADLMLKAQGGNGHAG